MQQLGFYDPLTYALDPKKMFIKKELHGVLLNAKLQVLLLAGVVHGAAQLDLHDWAFPNNPPFSQQSFTSLS